MYFFASGIYLCVSIVFWLREIRAAGKKNDKVKNDPPVKGCGYV
jgi:hypothetical protein